MLNRMSTRREPPRFPTVEPEDMGHCQMSEIHSSPPSKASAPHHNRGSRKSIGNCPWASFLRSDIRIRGM